MCRCGVLWFFEAFFPATHEAHAMTTLLLCELSDLVAAGIEVVVKQAACKVLACCRSGDEVLRMAEHLRPEIILASRSTLGSTAIATIRKLQALNGRTRVILMIERNPGMSAADLAEFNVDGVLISKGPATRLLECVKSVQEGRPWLDPDLLHHIAGTDNPSSRRPGMVYLTPREREIVRLVALGMSNKAIAQHATLTEGTVKMYLHHIMTKLRLGNRTQVAWYAQSSPQLSS